MCSHEVGTERHEGSDQGPSHFYFHLRHLDVVFSGTLQELDSNVEHIRADVIGNVEWALRNNGEKTRKPIRAPEDAGVDVGGCSRGCKRCKIILEQFD